MSKGKHKHAVTGLFLVGVLVIVAATTATSSFGSLARSERPASDVAGLQEAPPESSPVSPTVAAGDGDATANVPSAETTLEAASAGVEAARPAPLDPPTPPASPVMNYIVLPGDTLLELARDHETTVEQLLAINPGLQPARMRAGDVIKVPDNAAERGEFRPRHVWPAEGPITTPFGERGNSWVGGWHTGLDIGAFTGDVVWAADDGIIVDAGTNGRGRGYGTYILMYHFEGWYTLYAHLSEIYRPIGYVIRKGEPIGEVGSTGFSFGPHLHFEVWKGDDKLDPIQFLP